MGNDVADLQQFMPDSWRLFFRGRVPTPIQQAAIPPVLRGRSTLVSGPTASGKTEAVFAPLYQRHVSFARPEVSVVYVAPTKALVNDMTERLCAYFSVQNPDAVHRYTGDHHGFRAPAGGFVLTVTPEALDSLQLMQPQLLSGVRAVVCDEVHLLHGTARGQQLRSIIGRMRVASAPPRDSRDEFQVVVTTATVGDREAVAHVWCGESAAVACCGDPRQIELDVLDSPAGHRAHILAERLKGSESIRKVLVFSNTRNEAHHLAIHLSQRLAGERWPVHFHSGVLTATERERVERAMKGPERGVCVTTSTLEVGIDIGDIDVVVLASPPASIQSFLQRIGRGNRRSDRCVVWGCSDGDWQTSLYGALLDCAARGELDDVHDYDRPSVRFQQVISLAWRAARSERPLTSTGLCRVAGSDDHMPVIEDMLTTGILREIGGKLLPSDAWFDVADQRRTHTVISDQGGRPFVSLSSGDPLGLQGGVGEVRGQVFLGGQLQTIASSDSSGVYVRPARGRSSAGIVQLPSSRGSKWGLSRQLTWALARSSGRNPVEWRSGPGYLCTYGGVANNRLVSMLLGVGAVKGIDIGPFSISGLPPLGYVSPADLLARAQETSKAGLPESFTRKFREHTPYFEHLSPSMQQVESARSVPFESLCRWLREVVNHSGGTAV